MAPEIAGLYTKGILFQTSILWEFCLFTLLTGRTPHETPIQVINNVPFPKTEGKLTTIYL